MKTLGDIVLEDAKKIKRSGGSSTSEGIEFLELKNVPENYLAGNRYMAALNIINKLSEELEELRYTLLLPIKKGKYD